jgi:hypothetical protein
MNGTSSATNFSPGGLDDEGAGGCGDGEAALAVVGVAVGSGAGADVAATEGDGEGWEAAAIFSGGALSFVAGSSSLVK